MLMESLSLSNIGTKITKLSERERIKTRISDYVRTLQYKVKILELISTVTSELTLVKLKISREPK